LQLRRNSAMVARMSLIASLAFLLTVGTAAASPQSAPLDPGIKYSSCLSQVEIDPKAAIEVATTWAEAGGGVPAKHCQALALIELDRAEDAGDVLIGLGFDQTITDLDVRADLLSQAGNAYLLASRAEKARKALDGAISLRPGDPDLLIDRARAHAMAQSWVGAIADLDAAIELVPMRAGPYVLRASAKRQSGNLRGAKTDLELALQREEGNIDALLERGILRLQSGEKEAARVDLESVVAASPDSSAAQTAKAELAKLN
jgi:regulator of sirC expression with transglutaminase-like and TPR domain